jgi:chitin disaccharide deacetylase
LSIVAGTDRGLLIVNADDLGITCPASDAILECFGAGAISSATALVWMQDSDRAAQFARERHLPIGLHLNLIEPYNAPDVPDRVAATQRRVIERLRGGGMTAQLYHPAWSDDFEACIADQLSRFQELYGRSPLHVDGHRHMHLVPNALLARALTPVRRCRRPANRLAHESALYKRAGRAAIALAVRRRFLTTDWCFSVRSLHPAFGGARLDEKLDRARRDSVELFVHPGYADELAVLRSADWRKRLLHHRLGTFADLG